MCSLSTQGLPRMASPGPGVPHATSDRTVVEPHLPGALSPPHLSLSLAAVSILDSRGGVRPCGVGGSRLEASEAGLGYLNHPGLALPLNPWGICEHGRGAEWGAHTPISMLGRQHLRPWDLLGSRVAPALLTVWEAPMEQNLPLHGSTQTPVPRFSYRLPPGFSPASAGLHLCWGASRGSWGPSVCLTEGQKGLEVDSPPGVALKPQRFQDVHSSWRLAQRFPHSKHSEAKRNTQQLP